MPPYTGYNIFVADSADTNAFIQEAAAGNIDGNATVISNPYLDGNPNARILVTQNWSVNSVYNNHSVGAWYNGSNWTIINEDQADMPVGAAFNVYILKNEPSSFTHVAVSGNINFNSTLIDNKAINGNPNALVYVTRSNSGIYDTSSIGVWFDGIYWEIFNQDLSNMPAGASFNVYIGSPYFVHNTTADNIDIDLSTFDNPIVNYFPYSVIFTTHNYNPGGIGGTYHDKTLGVYYTGSHWGVFNQDGSNMPEGVSFNVAIAPISDSAFVHTSSSGSINNNWTVIDNPLLNGNPDAKCIVTPLYISSRHDKVIGVWYNGTNWSIFNQDLSTFETGAAFNVMVLNDANSLVQVADSSNTLFNYTLIDDPRLNNNPDANIIATQNWSVNDVYNNNEIGVWYNGSQWSVYNENLTDMPIGAAFNIYIAGTHGSIPVSVQQNGTNNSIVKGYELDQNYPNPFNPTTNIKFSLPEASKVTLRVYDILGRQVAELVNGVLSSGSHTVQFNASNYASGIYFYRLEAKNSQSKSFAAVKKMALLK